MSLEREIGRLQRGELTFDAFASQTRKEWLRLAGFLLRKFPAPAGVEPEDVAQELLLAAWRCSLRYDPSRGVSPGRHVKWTAIQRSKKFLDRQARRRDGGPPAIATPASWLADEEGRAPEPPPAQAAQEEGLLGLAAAAEREALAASVLAEARASGMRPALSRCAAALARCGGDLDAATEAVYEDGILSLALGAGSEGRVRACVRAAAQQWMSRGERRHQEGQVQS